MNLAVVVVVIPSSGHSCRFYLLYEFAPIGFDQLQRAANSEMLSLPPAFRHFAELAGTPAPLEASPVISKHSLLLVL